MINNFKFLTMLMVPFSLQQVFASDNNDISNNVQSESSHMYDNNLEENLDNKNFLIEASNIKDKEKEVVKKTEQTNIQDPREILKNAFKTRYESLNDKDIVRDIPYNNISFGYENDREEAEKSIDKKEESNIEKVIKQEVETEKTSIQSFKKILDVKNMVTNVLKARYKNLSEHDKDLIKEILKKDN